MHQRSKKNLRVGEQEVSVAAEGRRKCRACKLESRGTKWQKSSQMVGRGRFRGRIKKLKVPEKTYVGSGQYPKAKDEKTKVKLHLLESGLTKTGRPNRTLQLVFATVWALLLPTLYYPGPGVTP